MITNKALDQLEYFKVLEYIKRYAVTENGKEQVILSKPSLDLTEVILEGNLVEAAKETLISADYPPIDYVPNLSEALAKSRIQGGLINVNDIRDILKLAQISRRLLQFLKNNSEAELIKEKYAEGFFVDKVFENHIEKVFTPEGEIADSASSELRAIRKDIREKSDSLRKTVNKILKKLSESYLVQEEYITQRDGRIVVPVKSEHKRHVRGFIHSESATGQTVYIEPEETLELNNEILSLHFAEKREIDRILKNLTKLIGEKSFELKRSLETLSAIDSIFARARYSIEIIGAFPSFEKNKSFEILDGRHPILIKKMGREKAVPLNLKVDKNNILLITGPNAGGKTVVLKTVGLLCALVQSGIHIPVSADSNFLLFDNILMDIGDQQSIEEDLSTFSSHLSNINSILKNTDESSLVLLDEIGTGTDPSEGSALAAAVLLKLQSIGSIVLATTHHGSLKILANSRSGFENASMEFDLENLEPTYKFHQGLPGSSYAFEVASRIGFDDDFLKSAEEYLDTDKNKIEKFLVELETKSRNYQEKLNKLEIENTRLKGLANLYEEKISKLETQKKEILADAKIKAESYLYDVNKKIESAIKNIKESNASREVIKSEKSSIEELKKKTEELVKEIETAEEKNIGDWEIGDYAMIKDTTTAGTIIEIDREKKRALLNTGSIKLQVKLSSLASAKKPKEKADYTTKFYSPQIESLNLDIRGKKPEEAEYEVIRFLDDAFAASANRVEILHGKGTGALKATVHSILKKHEHVKNYYFAKLEFGGEGITIVELK